MIYDALNLSKTDFFWQNMKIMIFVKGCGLLMSPPCSLLFMWSSPLNARRKDNPDKNRRYKPSSQNHHHHHHAAPNIFASFRLWKSLLWKIWLRGIWLLRSVGFKESETFVLCWSRNSRNLRLTRGVSKGWNKNLRRLWLKSSFHEHNLWSLLISGTAREAGRITNWRSEICI